MNSWRRYLPDYELVLWDRLKAESLNSCWVNSAIAEKKWAFAADYIRLYALYNFGGIYLDLDVEVLKSLDDLLERSFFLGRESHKDVIEAAIIGAEPKLDWVKEALEWYRDKFFDVNELNNPSIAVPEILKKIFADYKLSNILPADYFSPKDNRTGRLAVTENSYTIHHFNGEWFSPYQREYFRIRVKYSQKYGAFIGFAAGSLFSLKNKIVQIMKTK